MAQGGRVGTSLYGLYRSVCAAPKALVLRAVLVSLDFEHFGLERVFHSGLTLGILTNCQNDIDIDEFVALFKCLRKCKLFLLR